jgi:formylmethanofuran dehydrogenase subunit E-like metal-binding protein
LISSISYKYHLETEEIKITLNKNIVKEAKKLNNSLHEEIEKIKKENEHFKSTFHEYIGENGIKYYYNLFTRKLVKKIDNENNIYEYDKNNGLLLKKTNK